MAVITTKLGDIDNACDWRRGLLGQWMERLIVTGQLLIHVLW